MPQLTIYLDDETNRLLAEACQRQGRSRSAVASEAIRQRLVNRLPDEWFATLGTWRRPLLEEILRGIRDYPVQRERAPFEQ